MSEDFLKRVFEYNCEVEDTEDQEGLLALQTDIMTQYSDHIEEIKGLFKAGGEGVAEKIRESVEETKYLEKLLEEISAKEHEIMNKS